MTRRFSSRYARKPGRPLTITVPGSGGGGGGGGTGGMPVTPADVTTGHANNRIVAWDGVFPLYGDDSMLNDFANNRHFGGLTIMFGLLYGFGGTENGFTGTSTATFNSADGRTGTQFNRQRQMKNSNFVARCAARGMDVYLGFYSTNFHNQATPFALTDWFDDSGWASYLSNARTDGDGLYNLMKAAAWMGCVGLTMDTENYVNEFGNNNETWYWDYPGNTHTEAQVRAKVKQRGAEMMTCLVAAWAAGGGAASGFRMEFYTSEPIWRSYRGLVFQNPTQQNLGPDKGKEQVYWDFWSGMLSVPGYGKITYVDAIFDKSTQIGGMSWDSAVQYGTNNFSATASRYFDAATWALACQKFGHNGQWWIDQGDTSFEVVVDTGNAALMGAAMRKYGTNGESSLYGHWRDYPFADAAQSSAPWSNYWSGFAASANSASPDNAVPLLSVSATGNVLSGFATHPEGVRCIEWSRRSGTDGSGIADSGALPMTWAADATIGLSAGFYNNKPMQFSQAVSGSAGSWYVVTATSFLGTAHSVVVQA